MKIAGKILAILLLGAAAVSAQPVVGADGIVSNASYFSSALPSGAIAQGSIFAVFGTGLGPSALAQASSFPLPTLLGGTSIKVTVGGTTVNAIILYTVATQVGAILPSNTPVGSGTLTVTNGSQTSAGAPIKVAAGSFGIFTSNQQGSGPAAAQDAVTFEVKTLTNAFTPGENAIIYGTGLGPITGSDASAPPPGALNVGAQLFVGGQLVPTQYTGRVSCCAGLDQINFVVPSGVAGCNVPVYLKVGGVVSNFATIAVSSTGKICSDATGFSSDDLTKILSGSGTFSTGSVVMSRSSTKFTLPAPIGTITSTTDSGSAGFFRVNYGNLITSGGISGYGVFGSCIVSVYKGQTVPNPLGTVTPLDAGTALTLTGPKGTKQLTKQALVPGFYGAQLGGGTQIPGGPAPAPLFLDPGSYTASGPGGADVGAFSKTITVPTLLTWTNQDSIDNVPRSQGLNITWSGADPSSFVVMTGSSSLSNPTLSVSFICTQRANVGQFTVPAEVLSLLPPSQTGSDTPTGFLGVSNVPLYNQSEFTATGLDAGYFTYYVGFSKAVTYQ